MLKYVFRFPVYFSLALFFITTSIILNICLSKTSSFILLNGFHARWLDIFFEIYTFLGDGIISIAAALLFAGLKKRKKAATILLAFASSGLAAQLLKNIFKAPRPKLHFEQTLFQYTHFVNGVTLNNSNSFPSGHTATAFAFATILVLLFKKKRITIPCFLGAVLVGYSRIYLAQHFLSDVLAGATIGVCCAVFSYYCIWDQKLLKALKPFRKKKKQFMPETTYPTIDLI